MRDFPPNIVLVFDLDDTLYLERDFASSGFAAVGEWAKKTLARDDVEKAASKLFRAGQRTNIFDAVLKELGIAPDPSLVADMVDIYRFHEPAITLQPDAHRLLKSLAGQPRLALITDGPRRTQENKVAALGLARFGFDPILVTDTWGRDYWKPHPRAYQAVADHYGQEGLDFVYVADNPAKDFVAPNAMGWTTVQIVRDGRVHTGEPPSAAHAAGARIETLDALSDALLPLLGSALAR